uniref:Uncharacterized protein n=1 Tax=Arundo donax TaxID=35708 RepID=A0A0A9ATM0_ARUDO
MQGLYVAGGLICKRKLIIMNPYFSILLFKLTGLSC